MSVTKLWVSCDGDGMCAAWDNKPVWWESCEEWHGAGIGYRVCELGEILRDTHWQGILGIEPGELWEYTVED